MDSKDSQRQTSVIPFFNTLCVFSAAVSRNQDWVIYEEQIFILLIVLHCGNFKGKVLATLESLYSVPLPCKGQRTREVKGKA